MSHIKMYKSGKFWVSSAVATLGAAAALVGGAGTSAQADATDANAQKAVDGSADVKAPETDEAGHVQVQISAAMAQNPTNATPAADETQAPAETKATQTEKVSPEANVDVQTATPEAQDATTDASADTESASNESSASTADDVKSDAQNPVTETPAEAADVKADAQSGATESQDVKPDDQ